MDGLASEQPTTESEADRSPLLMEQQENHIDSEHIIDVSRTNDDSASSSQDEDRPSDNTGDSTYESLSTSNRVISRNSSSIRSDARRPRSPLNSRLWISVELVVTVVQIVASIVVLSLSGDEDPQAPLFAWIVGYASGCVATLPILYWRYRNRNQGDESGADELQQGLSQGNPSSEPASYTAISVTQASEVENQQTMVSASTNNLSSRLNGLVDNLKMGLDCFFAVWFVVGNVWIFGGHSSPSDAPKLYRLCIVFLTFSCIGYAMPFILCAAICCCLPCIISILGLHENLSHTKGATPESISALPTYKFKVKKISGEGDDNDDDQDVSSGGGVLAAGTEHERTVSAEDAVCCICLANYAEEDELRELPCSHFFHVQCVDKWLQINALCPLCKCEVGETGVSSPSSPTNSVHHPIQRRAGSDVGAYRTSVF